MPQTAAHGNGPQFDPPDGAGAGPAAWHCAAAPAVRPSTLVREEGLVPLKVTTHFSSYAYALAGSDRVYQDLLVRLPRVPVRSPAIGKMWVHSPNGVRVGSGIHLGRRVRHWVSGITFYPPFSSLFWSPMRVTRRTRSCFSSATAIPTRGGRARRRPTHFFSDRSLDRLDEPQLIYSFGICRSRARAIHSNA